MRKCHFVILAGGASHRYGRDKVLEKFNSITFLAHKVREIQQLHRFPKNLYLSLNSPSQLPTIKKSLSSYFTIEQTREDRLLLSKISKLHEKSTLKIIYDSIPPAPTFKLPHIPAKRAVIFALHRLFNDLSGGFVFLTSIDTPLFGKQCMSLMLSLMEAELAMDHSKFDAFIPQWANGFIEPLNGLYRINAFKQTIEKQIFMKNYKIADLLHANGKVSYISIEQRFAPIDASLKCFTNYNKPTEK